MTGSLPGLRSSSPALPGTPAVGAKANGLKSDRFTIEDDDLDELAESVPSSSPYFTQPTQIIRRTTQPTQIVNRTTQPTQLVEPRTTLQRSSPPIPDTPNSVVEVPASSPFQTQSQHKRPAVKTLPFGARIGQAGGRLASLMAPAGTAFRAPPASTIPRRPQPAIKPQFLSAANSDDDDLTNDYKRHDSSDEDSQPMRGEIKPSSFVRKQQSPVSKAGQRLVMEDKDISLNDIPDLRLRYLTKQTHKAVVKPRPEITIRQCRDALQKNGMSTEDAVLFLVGSLKDTGASTGSNHKTTSSRTTVTGPQPILWNQTKLPKPQTSRQNSSSPPPSPELAKNNPPRRRLMQGRRKRTPSPEKVFSVSSSHASSSVATTPSSSSSERASKMAVAAKPSTGSRTQDPDRRSQASQLLNKRDHSEFAVDAVITIGSDSDSDSDSDSGGFPSLSSLAKKRKVAPVESPERKKPGRLISRATKLQKEARRKETSLTPEVEAVIEIDSEGSGSDSRRHVAIPAQEHASVLQYLNGCSAEELARMTSYSLKDAQLVVSKRPFKSLSEVESIKTKGTKKSKKSEIGFNVIYKLDTWFKAFDSVTTVIRHCDNRGRELQAYMAQWEMDRNGQIRATQDATQLKPLPIPERPALMATDIDLKSYQLFGLNWMGLLHSRGYSGILADDMGLGKTCQVISFISHLVKTDPEARPNVIVVPPSTFENWSNEFDRFAPGISLFNYQGMNRQLLSQHEAMESDVVLTTYSMLERNPTDIEWLNKLSPYAAIFDEGHKLKNPNTLIYKNLSRLHSEWRLVLTGTPVQNNLKELLGLLSFVEPGLFEDGALQDMHTIFEAKVPNKDVLNFAALAKERVTNARTIMVPFILQRRKGEVVDLPPKVDTLALVQMTGAQKTLYEEIKGNFLQGKSKSKGGNSTDKGNLWQQLRKAAIHPHLFRRHFTDKMVDEMVDILWKKCSERELQVSSKDERFKTMFRDQLLSEWDFQLHLLCKEFPKYISRFDVPNQSWEKAPKVQKLLELVKGYQANGDRCLVFSRFEMVIDILRDTMHYAGIGYCELTGRTDVADRFPEIEKFKENPNIPVFLLTTGAGGTGLNLTAANKIILFDQSDNPQDDVQASNRAHRIGQTRDVEVIRLITDHTVETMIYNSCIKKLALAASVEGQIEDEESLEQECRKKMLFGDEEVAVPASQIPNE